MHQAQQYPRPDSNRRLHLPRTPRIGVVGELVGIELSYGFGGSWGLFPQSIPR